MRRENEVVLFFLFFLVTLSWNETTEEEKQRPGEREPGDQRGERMGEGEPESAAAGPSGEVCPSVSEGTTATLSMVLDKEYQILKLEKRKLLLEIEVSKLQQHKFQI